MHTSINHGIRLLALSFLTATTFTSCIDENLKDCGKDYKVNYTVQLHTNISTEIETELTTDIERQFGVDLSSTLADVFTDHARDLDLSFYTDDARLAQHDTHQMDASQASYTIFLPVQRYKNLAVANTAVEPIVNIDGLQSLDAMRLVQTENVDTVPSQQVGLFSARLPMEIENRDQEFHVNLYMQNCTACLVLDPGSVAISDVRGCVTGLASSFAVNDSVYSFDHSVPVRANKLRASNGRLIGLYATGFPSSDTRSSILPSDESQQSSLGRVFPSAETDNSLWQFKVYVHLANGKTTESTLYVLEPLRAGNLRIIKAAIRDDGSLVTTTQNIGVSVKLDWKPGGEHDVEV